MDEQKPAKLRLKMSPRKKKALLVVIVLALIAAGVYYRQWRKENLLNGSPAISAEELQKIVAETNAAADEYQEPTLDSAQIEAINKLITDKKYVEAKAKVDKLFRTKGLTPVDKDQLYGALNVICSETKNVQCLTKVLAYIESTNPEEPPIGQYVVIARIAKAQGDTTVSKKYYAKALTAIDNLGGEEYLEKTINESSELSLEYKELVDGAN